MMELLIKIIKEFISLFISVLPFFILGSVLGAFLDIYIKAKYFMKYLNKKLFSIFAASLLGAILPGCACATMPIAQGIKEKGASIATISAFILISPLLSPQTIILTYSLLGWKFALGRILFSFLGSITLGLFFLRFKEYEIHKSILIDSPIEQNCECSEINCQAEKKGFLKSLIKIIKDLGKYFLLGMFIASVLTTIIPEEMVPKYIGSSGIYAYIIAAIIGIPLYVCEGEEIPLTLALLKLHLSAGPAFTFLIGSVGTCIPTMIMAKKIIGKKPTLFYIIFWFPFSILSGIIINMFL